MKNILAITALTAFSTLPAAAMDEPPATAEILSGWVKKDGSRVAALRVNMAPGWKTYWRVPGDAGIPPQFDWSASRNLGNVSVAWPAPRVFDQNGMRSVGYENDLIIPLIIQPDSPGRPVELNVSMDLGICSDICIPYELEFSATLDGQNSTPEPAIAAALAETPYTAQEAGVTAATCRISPTSEGLEVEARVSMPPAGGTEFVVIESGVPGVWVSEARTQRQGGDVVAVSEMIHIDSASFALNRSDIRITVLGGSYAVDIQGCTAG